MTDESNTSMEGWCNYTDKENGSTLLGEIPVSVPLYPPEIPQKVPGNETGPPLSGACE